MAVREGDPSLITFEFSERDGKDYFEIKVDREKIRTSGFKALSEFLHKLHVYKSMGDYDSAKKFFDHYSEVDAEMLKIREIVIANKLPRRLELQPNLFLNQVSSTVDYKDYSDDFEGVISSYVERFPDPFQADVWFQWKQDAAQLRYAH